jgi:hypothetical protein
MAAIQYCKPVRAKHSLLPWQVSGLTYTASGYGRKIPTSRMVQLADNPKWYRVYCCIYSNIGTCYIVRKGEWFVIRESDMPEAD